MAPRSMELWQLMAPLFACAVNPDANAGSNPDLRRKACHPKILRQFLDRRSSRIGNRCQRRGLPFKQPGIDRGADFRALAHSRGGGRDLRGEAREQGHKGKDEPVHCGGI
ncbi:MAG: hypothetical protein ACKOOL_00600 [Novosphingobium sp.]